MPNLGEDEEPTTDSRMRLLLLGDSKVGKTDYAVQAAEQGFFVVYIDGDVAIQTITSMHAEGRLSKEAMKRIFYMRVGDITNDSGGYITRFADFWKEFSMAGVFTWNDTLGEVFSRAKYQDTHRVWQMRPARMGPEVVLIFDSWTAYVQSVMQWKADTIDVDLAEIEKVGRDVYSGVGNKLTQSLVVIQNMKCHVIVIGHPDEDVKNRVQEGVAARDQEKNAVVESVKTIPKSSSRPHGRTMAKHFSDVGWIELLPSRKRQITFVPSTARTIGGHFSDAQPVEKRTVADIIKKIGGIIPETLDSSAWLTRYGPGEFVPAGAVKVNPLTQVKAAAPAATADPIAPAEGAPAIKLGLAGLLKKQAGPEQ